MGVNLFLAALVNEDGSKPKASELPTADQLMAAHANADLLDAVTLVQRHSYGTLEEATKTNRLVPSQAAVHAGRPMGRAGPPQNSRTSGEHTDPLAGLF